MKIIGTGRANPAKIVTNAMLEEFLDTSDEWIRERTGMTERHVISNEKLEDLAAEAARKAIEDAGITPEDIDYIICSNVVNEYITPYIGVAWEHEFDGESSATTNNLPILEPDLRGDTGIGEIGLTITPSETIPLTVDLGVTGYVGTREGISGSLLVKWTF